MPFASQAQRRWAHTPSGLQALGGPAKVAEWDRASKGLKLPPRVPAAAPKKNRVVLRRYGRTGIRSDVVAPAALR